MKRYYLTHTDAHGERHQLAGAWEAATPEAAIAQMLTQAGEQDDGHWQAQMFEAAMVGAPLDVRAREYAQLSLREITADPALYGVTKPWKSIDEWIAFELDGDAGDEFPTQEERDAITAAMRQIDLAALNAPWST